MGMKSAVAVGCLVVYFIIILGAVFLTKTGKLREKNIEEFAVGSRTFGWIIMFMSLMGLMLISSIFTSWFVLSGTDGLFAQYLVIYTTFSFILNYVFAKRLWVWGKNHNLLTQPDFFQLRFGSKGFTLFMACIVVFIEAPWVFMEFSAMGTVMEGLTYGAIGHKFGTVLVTTVVALYIIYSGMRAVAITEVIQGFLSSVVVAFGLIAIIYTMYGGFGPLYQAVFQAAPENLTIANGGHYGYWASVCLAGALATMGYPSYVTRIFTMKNVIDIKKSTVLSIGLTAVVTFLLMAVGLGIILFPDVVAGMQNGVSYFILADKALGPLFMGLAGVMVIAAGMSMCSVVMNSHAVIISENIVKPFKPNMSSGDRFRLARWTSVIYSIFCLFIALTELPALYKIQMLVCDCIIQAVPLTLLGLFWKRSNKWAAIFSVLIGFSVTIIMTVGGYTILGFSGGIVGVGVNALVHIIGGFAFPKDKNVDILFDEIKVYDEEQYKKAIQAENMTA